jgi:hypothetical protein
LAIFAATAIRIWVRRLLLPAIAVVALLAVGPDIHVHWVTFRSDGSRCPEGWSLLVTSCQPVGEDFELVNVAYFANGVDHHHIRFSLSRPATRVFNLLFSEGAFDLGVVALVPVGLVGLVLARKRRLKLRPPLRAWHVALAAGLAIYLVGPQWGAGFHMPYQQPACPHGYSLYAGDVCQTDRAPYVTAAVVSGRYDSKPFQAGFSLYLSRPSIRLFVLSTNAIEGLGLCHLEGEFVHRVCE